MKSQPERNHARHGEAAILFTVAASTFAIAASAVEEIRSAEALRPWSPPEGAPETRASYRLERAGRYYYVVDAGLHFFGSPALGQRVLVLRNRAAAVLVEQIGRMTEISALYALPHAFTGQERQWYRGLAVLAGTDGQPEVVPVVNPDAFATAAAAPASVPRFSAQGAAL